MDRTLYSRWLWQYSALQCRIWRNVDTYHLPTSFSPTKRNCKLYCLFASTICCGILSERYLKHYYFKRTFFCHRFFENVEMLTLIVQGYSLSAPKTVGICDSFKVSWEAPAMHYIYDYICLYQRNPDGTTTQSSCQQVGSGGLAKGTLSFSVTQTGTFFFSYNLSPSVYSYPCAYSNDFEGLGN